MAQAKYYVVWAGHRPGVYSSWAECKAQTDNYKDAKYKSFPSKAAAEQAYRDGWQKHWGKKKDGTGSPAREARLPAPRRPRWITTASLSMSAQEAIRGR